MSTTESFSESYRQARDRFRTMALRAGAQPLSYRNDAAQGPDSEDLCTDVAWLGPESASRVVVAVSGTHGVEGYCGSACQLDLLRRLTASTHANTAFLLVHALN